MVMSKGVTPAKDGINGSRGMWSATSTRRNCSATTPSSGTLSFRRTFVPPHIHPTQDEWITVLTGKLEIEFGPEKFDAGPGETVRMPMGIAHGIFNRSGAEATCVFGVAPSRKLNDLFSKLDGVTNPDELVRISALHEVDFLPPPPQA